MRLALPFSLALALASAASVSCGPPRQLVDAGPHYDAPPAQDAFAWPECHPGETRCTGNTFQRCVPSGEFTDVQNTDCSAAGQVCVAALGGCAPCLPGSLSCSDDQSSVTVCRADGSGFDHQSDCDVGNGVVCRGGECRSLCDLSGVAGSNVGCEYYAADLDNAVLGAGESAASQQYAVVVSNPDPTFFARVRVERNSAPPGMPPRIETVATDIIPPLDLTVLPLPAREVDCSAPGTFNTGTGTCLSSQAYRITTTVPVIAAQFNPLDNGLQFSNDASLLVPTNSLSGDYLAMGWPETLASSPPEVVLNSLDPQDLRGFVTVVGTAAGTHVHVVPRADVIPGGPLTGTSPAGTPIDVTLGPFDVLNLETGAFLADFTGTQVTADKPVVLFSGSECSDVPEWMNLTDRECCCDHLESQVFPRNTTGSHYVAVHTPRRTPVVAAAGAPVAVVPNEPEFFRVLAVGTNATHVTTTVPSTLDTPDSPPLEFDLMPGEFREIRSWGSFEVNADGPVSVANFMSSQLNTGIPLDYPGGDPSFIPVPAIEQWRDNYVFLTPNKYAFDFVSVVAPAGATVSLDGDPLPTTDCTVERGDGCTDTRAHPCAPSQYTVYQCQFSFPTIDPSLPYPMNVSPGRQRDGVHVLQASEPVGAIVSGFDLRVSYGYPAGTQLRPLF